jgi:hypothetical protein
MSSYPGEDPQQPGQPADEPSDTEPTQPVGYWERQAAEERARQAGHPDPTTPYPQGYPGPGQPDQPGVQGQNPYGAPAPPAGQAPPPPGQAGPNGPPVAAPQASYSAAPGWYGGPPAYAAYRPVAPDHPQSTLALILGLVGLIGSFVLCGLPLVVSPFAWALGSNALKEIRASQGRLGGESQARTGMILGIVGTALAVLLVLVVVLFVVLVATSASTPTGSSV